MPGDKSALEYSRDAASPILRQIEAIFISVRAGIFAPDAPRSQRWSGAYTLDEAVKLASCQHGHYDVVSLFGNLNTTVLGDGHVSSSGVEPEETKRASSPVLGPQSEEGHDLSHPWHDDMTLAELGKIQSHVAGVESSSCQHFQLSDASDVSDSVSSSCDGDSDSDDAQRRVELDGERNSRDLVAPSDIAGKKCFRHVKSKKLHLVEKCVSGSEVFKCGRKCNSNYEKLECVPSFTAHGCLTCFGWSMNHDSDSASS